MTENRTLGEFGGESDADGEEADGTRANPGETTEEPDETPGESVGEASSEPTDETASGPAADTADAVDDAQEPAAVDDTQDSSTVDPAAADPAPATVTYAWSADGDACAECGETTDARWRAGEGAADPDALVCPSCKEW